MHSCSRKLMAAQTPKNMEKKGEKEKEMPADTCRRTIPQKLLDQDCAKAWVFQIDPFLTTLDIKENSLTLTEGCPHELSNLRQSLSCQMHHVHQYSMYVFLQQKTDGSPNNIQKTWKRKGRKRRECQRTPAEEQYPNNFWTWHVQRHGFPKLTRF